MRKAADDLYVARRLAQDVDAPAWILGFHAQQAVEKSLKAVLSLHRIEFPRTHNLSMLLELLRRAALALPPDGDELARLIPFGVIARYETALDATEVEIDRVWAVDVATRTFECGEGAVGLDRDPTTNER
ncbi:MAG: HEPN domain-containing protein [Betaproteobacteria bacterium]|nr:HEPN domain-containing protein [Betaproteobacteria bacterium]